MASCGVAIVSPENLDRINCGLDLCDLHLPAFLGATSSVTTQPSSLVFAEPTRWAMSFIFRGARFCIVFDSKHAALVAVGTSHAARHISLALTCKELLLPLKCKFHVSAHHVYCHAGNTGNECADAAASLSL